MRAADFAERFLALFERLVLAVESIATSLVNRKALPSAPTQPSALPPFQPEAASGERLAQVLASDERRKAKQREAMQRLRAKRREHEPSLSMPSNVTVLRDAGDGPRDITNRSDRDGGDFTNHHTTGDGCDVTSVTCDFTVGGGGGVFQGGSSEISPVFPPKEAQRDLRSRARGDVTGDGVAQPVTAHVTSQVTTSVRAPLARTARSPTDDGCFGMAVAAWVEGVMSVTGKDYLSPQGSELNLLLALIETHAKDVATRIDWARGQGAAFAQSGPSKLNVFTFKDFVQTPARNRVQPAPAQGERSWSTRRKKEAT